MAAGRNHGIWIDAVGGPPEDDARQQVRDYEKLGAFYMGRVFDPDQGQVRDEPLLYDAKDLTTHAVCVGMTGSGKTGLCVTLLEEAAIDGIPTLAIDPKGDLGNLMLTFPELRPADFEPWIDPAVAARKGRTAAEQARATAEAWREGLARAAAQGSRSDCCARSRLHRPRSRRTQTRCASARSRRSPACWPWSAWTRIPCAAASTSCSRRSSTVPGARGAISISPR
jgi:hypothetical protein